MKVKFSVLMSVYYKEEAENLDECLESIFTQSLRPSEVVLVEDGPISDALKEVIEKYRDLLGIVSVILEENVGLATALNAGIKKCSNDLVARMDTDDIVVAGRFKKQIEFLNEHPDYSVVGGFVEEWDQTFKVLGSVRRVPLTHKDIVKFSKRRSPVSHPSVMYRRQDVLSVGGYPDFYPEDYALWILMLNKGMKFANLNEVLVRMRIESAITERRGLKFFMGEIRIFQMMRTFRFINAFEFYSNVAIRAVVRLSPNFVKRYVYRYFR